jgi:light-regulated signal transduction histidine kinase (bacteriophytochrome)
METVLNDAPWSAELYSLKRHGVQITNCDSEPVQTPGCIQSHGVLVAFQLVDLAIQQVSENVGGLLGVQPDDLLGKPLSALLGDAGARRLQAFLSSQPIDRNPLYCQTQALGTSSAEFHLIVHSNDGVGLLELEPSVPHAAEPDYYSLVKKSIVRLQGARSVQEFCQVACDEVRELTGLDRVMAYFFHEDGSGEVIAEARGEDLDSWLGLHYPAHDIPQPAREIFKRIWVRPLPDAAGAVAEMVPLANPGTGRGLDMTYCGLRGASVMYTEYLHNMGVAASLTLSMRHAGRLWGLIAGHHLTSTPFPWQARAACELLAQTVSLQLAYVEEREHERYRARMQAAHLTALARVARSGELSRLTQPSPTLLDGIQCGGAAVYQQDQWFTVGDVPGRSELSELAAWLRPLFASADKEPQSLYATDRLSEVYPGAAGYAEVASGVLAVSMSKTARQLILWFRPAVAQTVAWAGNPSDAPTVLGPHGPRLTPRASFTLWQESVAARSLPWTTAEREAALYLRSLVMDLVVSRSEELGALNSELASSNEELDAFAYVASHDLKEPLRGIHRHAALLKKDIEAGRALDAQALERLEAVTRLTVRMDGLLDALLHFSRVGRLKLQPQMEDLNAVLAESIEMLGTQPAEARCSIRIPRPLPHVLGDRVRIREIFTNLLSNAIKYNDKAERWVEIGYIEPHEATSLLLASDTPAVRQQTIYYVRDNGIGIAVKHRAQVFGIFKRLHTRDAFGGGSGAGLTIARRLVERHGGLLWLTSALGEGSTFFFTLAASEAGG